MTLRLSRTPQTTPLKIAHGAFWLEIVLVGDRRARSGLSDYTDEYYDRFYSQVGAT
jgi:hypothetical protein